MTEPTPTGIVPEEEDCCGYRPLLTHFRDHYTEVNSDRAADYALGSDGKYHHLPNSLTAIGSSALFSTVDDLALWMSNMRSGTKYISQSL